MPFEPLGRLSTLVMSLLNPKYNILSSNEQYQPYIQRYDLLTYFINHRMMFLNR